MQVFFTEFTPSASQMRTYLHEGVNEMNLS